MKLRAEILALSTVTLMAVAGCTPAARQDVGQAGSEIGQATEKSVEGTKQAADKAGDKMAQGVENANEAMGDAAKKTGDAIKTGVENTGEAIGGAAKSAEKATQNAAAVTTLTPKVKNALVVSKQIDASTLNVDTDAKAKMVIIKGTQPTEAKKKLVTDIAAKTLADAKSDYKVKNEVTVGGKM
jgi:hypothetical protein